MGDAPRFTARDRNDINVFIAFIVPGKGDPFAVRRKTRERFGAARRGEAVRMPALASRDPNVARINKSNVFLRNRRHLHETRVELGGGIFVGSSRREGDGEGETKGNE